jgi:hypothetical protein
MVAMIALGIVIGMSIGSGPDVSMNKKTDPVPAATDQQITPPEGTQPQITDELVNQSALILPDSNKTAEVEKKPVKIIAPKKTQAAPDANQPLVTSGETVKNEPDIVTGKEDEPVKKALPKPTAPDLEKMVAVSSNDYEVGPFGGISRLSLTVKNTSDYALNLVVVQVEYLKPNKEVFKTENLYFRDIAANGSITLEAPRSSRGNKVSYKVTLINSKDHLFHAGN